MNRSLWVTWALMVSAVAACDHSSTGVDAGDPDAGSSLADAGSSTVTLSGPVAGTTTVVGPTMTYTPSSTQGELDIRANLSGVNTQLAFYFPNEPSLTTYTANSGAGVDCSLQIYVGDGGIDGWAANYGAGLPDLGACSLTLTSSTVSADHGTQKDYAVHGSFSAMAPAHSGAASGTVGYAASF